MTATFSAFGRSEYDERFARARQTIKAAGLVACILSAPENIYYFSGYDSCVSVNSPQALIFTADEDNPTLILRDADVALALETTWVGDIRTYNLVTEDYADRVKHILTEKGVSEGRIAIEFSSYALPMILGDALRDAMGVIELVDSTSLLGDLRHLKTPAEMAYMEKAAQYANLGLAAMCESAVTGMSEISLAAEVEAAMRRAGSDYWAIPTELSSGTRTAGGHAAPRNRLIEMGDLVHAEFAGVAARYHAAAIQTIGCGEPSPQARELYDIGIASLVAGIEAIKPGVAVEKIEEASLQPLRAHGLENAAMMRFGYGIGIAYPPIWLETLQISRGFDFTLEPGMAFVLHSCIELPEENLGVIQWGYVGSGKNWIAPTGRCRSSRIESRIV